MCSWKSPGYNVIDKIVKNGLKQEEVLGDRLLIPRESCHHLNSVPKPSQQYDKWQDPKDEDKKYIRGLFESESYFYLDEECVLGLDLVRTDKRMELISLFWSNPINMIFKGNMYIIHIYNLEGKKLFIDFSTGKWKYDYQRLN